MQYLESKYVIQMNTKKDPRTTTLKWLTAEWHHTYYFRICIVHICTMLFCQLYYWCKYTIQTQDRHTFVWHISFYLFDGYTNGLFMWTNDTELKVIILKWRTLGNTYYEVSTHYHILPHITTYYHILSHLTTHYRILSHFITFYHILSHIITYYHILSHLIT